MHFPIDGAVARSLPKKASTLRQRRPPASRKLFLPGEMPAEFFALLNRFFERYRPTDLSAARDVADYTRAAWFYLRHSRARETFETKLNRRKPDPAFWTQAESEQIEALRDYRKRARRSLRRAFKKIWHLRIEHPDEPVSYKELHNLFVGILDLEGFPYNFG